MTLRHFDPALVKSVDKPGPVFGQNLVYDCHAVHTTHKLRAELGLRPRYTLASGLAQTWEWYQARRPARAPDRLRVRGPAPRQDRRVTAARHPRVPPRAGGGARLRRRSSGCPAASSPSTSPRRPTRPPPSSPTTEILYAWNFPAAAARAARPELALGPGAWAPASSASSSPSCRRGVIVTRAAGIFGPWMAEYTLGWCLWVTQRMEHFRAQQRAAPLGAASIRCACAAPTALRRRARRHRPRDRPRGARPRHARDRRDAQRPAPSRRPSASIARAPSRRRSPRADFVVLTVPLTPATRGLIGARELAAMKPSAWLINIARGPVVDEAALLEALRDAAIGGRRARRVRRRAAARRSPALDASTTS